ncbi:MAG: RNA polymerase sporulation sigma factor SigG [Clostridiales bacterium]|nr:MAG: RNA polymerase sporulation sigma factor SigG [Clostridiales bacterium]
MLNKVVISGVDTSKLPILSNDEKNELLRRIKAGDKKAKDQFVEGNLRLVLSIVQRFAGRGECMDDLFQVGCIGLIKSIDNFDLSLGLRFSTYGVPMILGEIRRYLRDNNMVRVSRATRDLAYKALTVKERLANEKNREPTISEIAKELEVKKEEVVMALDAIVDPISLFEPVYSDGNDAIYVMDQVSDGRGGDDWLDELLIKDAINKLPDREKNIIELRFLEGKTQMEVAEEVGISQAQVSRLEKGAMERIKGQL